MKAWFKIELDDNTFADGDNAPYELARILRDAADKIDDGTSERFSLKDCNGKIVGEMRIIKESA